MRFFREFGVCMLLATPAAFAQSNAVLTSAAFKIPEFQAQYALYQNGDLLGTSEITLKKSGAGYQFSTKSQSEGGMASIIGGASIAETSEFKPEAQHLQSLSYRYEQRISFKKRKREIEFDWRKSLAREDDGKDVTSYLLSPGAIDRHLVVLALAQDLSRSAAPTANTGAATDGKIPTALPAVRNFSHLVAYKGTVEPWQFRSTGVERVTTDMGVIQAEKIERVRAKASSGRSTTSWHAARFNHLPIRILQREPDGETLEMRLKSITLAPNVVSKR
jgi:hypothetical protein